MGIVDEIKQQAKKSGTNKGKFLYFKSGTKLRVRFLEDMDDGKKITFHDSFEAGINVPCQETFDRECKYCEDDELRTRDQYAWCVWDYEAKEVKILMCPVNQCSPVPALVAMYETYGTLTDRDYVITKSGQQQSTTYSVVPMDKAKFRNEKAKPFSDSKFYDFLDKAYPVDGDDDEEEEEKPKKGKKKPAPEKTSKGKKKPKPEPEEEEDEEDEEGDEEEMDYSEMSAIQLYKECKKRDIEAKTKQKPKYYIQLLEDDDSKSEDGWDDDEDGDEEDEW